jgi:hypothetical protein
MTSQVPSQPDQKTREMQVARSHLLRATEAASNEGNEVLVTELTKFISELNQLISRNGSKAQKLIVNLPVTDDAP